MRMFLFSTACLWSMLHAELLLAQGTATTVGPVVKIAAITPVEKGLQRLVEQPALMEPYAHTPIYSKVSGYVDKVHVEIGQPVKAGESLLTIAVPELQAELKQKEALVKQAEAVIAQAKSAIEVATASEQSAQASVAEYQALVTSAEADVARYRSEFDRVSELAAKNAVPTKVRDEVQNQLQSAQALLAAAQSKQKTGAALIAEMVAKIESARADLKAAMAKFDVAVASLDQTKVMIEEATIKAPFAGAVAKRHVEQGHLVTANQTTQTALLTIVQTHKLRVLVEVPESESGYLAAENPVTLRVPALSNLSINCTVTRVSAALDQQTRTLRAEIELDSEPHRLKPGLFAQATITVAQREKCLVIPFAAILVEAGKSYCLAVEGGQIVRKPLELGLRAGSEVEVRSGLDKTSQIVPKNPGNYTVGQVAEVLPSTPK
jgi:HlyD family secretion protein